MSVAVQQMVDADDETFERVVLANLGAEVAHEVWEVFTDPDVVHRTKAVLRATLADVHQQLLMWKADPQSRSAEWRGRVGHFNILLSRRQAQVLNASRDAHMAGVGPSFDAPKSHNRWLVQQLTIGINNHRLACIAADVAPEPHDLALWALLDELRLENNDPNRDPDDGSTLAEMVVNGVWYAPVGAVV